AVARLNGGTSSAHHGPPRHGGTGSLQELAPRCTHGSCLPPTGPSDQSSTVGSYIVARQSATVFSTGRLMLGQAKTRSPPGSRCAALASRSVFGEHGREFQVMS